MTCDRTAQVHAYHDGELTPGGRLVFESHLAECAECAALLRELRAMSKLISAAPLPGAAGDLPLDRYYAAWDASRQRSVLRISSWLTAAAAAVLIGSLLMWPQKSTDTPVARTDAGASWETVALMPPSTDRYPDRPDELIELAQWMADDLSVDGVR